MKGDFIVFDMEAECIAAIEICWIQWIKDKIEEGIIALDSSGKKYTTTRGLTELQIRDLKIGGTDCNGKCSNTKGATLNYQIPNKGDQVEKWYFAKPPLQYLELLTGYTIKTHQQMYDEGILPLDPTN